MNVTKTTRLRTKFVAYPNIDAGFNQDSCIHFTLDLDQDSDHEVAQLLKLRDQLTDILESVMPGSQRPLPDDEIGLTDGLKRFHRVHSLAYPDAGVDKGFASV